MLKIPVPITIPIRPIWWFGVQSPHLILVLGVSPSWWPLFGSSYPYLSRICFFLRTYKIFLTTATNALSSSLISTSSSIYYNGCRFHQGKGMVCNSAGPIIGTMEHSSSRGRSWLSRLIHTNWSNLLVGLIVSQESQERPLFVCLVEK